MMTTKRLSNPHIRKSGCPTVVRAGTCRARPGLLFACRDTGQSVAVVAARVVTARSVIAAVGSVRRITGAVVAVCWIAVARVAVRRITIAVGRRRDRATNYACGNAGANPTAQTPRLCGFRGSNCRGGNAGGRDDGRNYLTHRRVLHNVPSGCHFAHEGNLNGTFNHTWLGTPRWGNHGNLFDPSSGKIVGHRLDCKRGDGSANSSNNYNLPGYQIGSP